MSMNKNAFQWDAYLPQQWLSLSGGVGVSASGGALGVSALGECLLWGLSAQGVVSVPRGGLLSGDFCSRGCLLLGDAQGGGGVCSRRVSAPVGVCSRVVCSRGRSAPGGFCFRGCLLSGVSARGLGGQSAPGGVCLPPGVSALGDVCSGGRGISSWGCGIQACTEADTPPPVDRQTPVKT